MDKIEYIVITKSNYFSVVAGDICIVTNSISDDNYGVSATKIHGTYSLYHSKRSFKRITLTELEEVIYGIKAD